jgi:hypothetical protein
MPITIAMDRAQGLAVMAAACRSHLPAEVRFPRSSGPPMTSPTTFLAQNEELVYIQRPAGSDGPIEPAIGERVWMTFNIQGRRFGLEAVVRGPKQVSIGGGLKVGAIELGPPCRVYEVRRRGEYRVPLWGMAPVPAHLQPLFVGKSDAAMPAEPFHAELQNVSVSGVAVLVNPPSAAGLAVGQNFLMDFLLPGYDEPFNFAVTVRHLRRMPHSGVCLMGLRFIPGDDAQTNHEAIRKIRAFAEVHRRLRS